MNFNFSRRSFLQGSGALLLGLGATAAAPGVARSASLLGRGFPRRRPDAVGADAEGILGFLRAIEGTPIRLHSLMVVKKGAVIAEGWWAPYAPQWRHTLYSLSKSFTSTAIGLAADGGHLSVDDRVLDYFPDDLPESVGPHLAAMRVKHLLMMGAGHAGDSLFGGKFTMTHPNWARSVLARPVEYYPGTHFAYNNGATYLLSAILQKSTGQTVLNFLEPRLFAPLGIEGADWEQNPQGINPGAWGLRVRTEDIARLGQLYLQKGMWQGRRILSESWVHEATRVQIQNASDPDPAKNAANDWSQGYGYQFWRCRHGAYRGDGAYGQYCLVLPEQESVIAINSETPDMQAVLNQVWTHVLPALGRTGSAGGTTTGSLTKSLAALELEKPKGAIASPTAAAWQGRVARFQPNSLGFQTVSLEFRGSQCRAVLTDAHGRHLIDAGFGRWTRGESRLPLQVLHLALASEPASQVTLSSAAWTDERTLKIRVQFVETAHYQHLIFRFDGDTVSLEFERSIAVVFPGGGKDPRQVLTAKREA